MREVVPVREVQAGSRARTPPAINYPPFSIRPGAGPARGGLRSVRGEAPFACSMVLAYGQVFTVEKPRRRASPTHSNSRLKRSAEGALLYPQCELVRARALPVLNSADATSARSLRLRRLLGGRRLDPRAQAAVPLHRPAVFVTVRRPLGLLRLAFIV